MLPSPLPPPSASFTSLTVEDMDAFLEFVLSALVAGLPKVSPLESVVLPLERCGGTSSNPSPNEPPASIISSTETRLAVTVASS